MYFATLLVSLMIWVVVGYLYLRSRLASVFHPFTFYYLFHGLLFVIRPFLSYWLDYQQIYHAYHFTPTLSDKITVLMAASLGLLAFAFGALRTGNVPMRFKQDVVAVVERNRLVGPFVMVMAVCAPIAYYSLLGKFAIASQGVIDKALVKGTGVFVNTSGNGYFEEAQVMLVSCTAIFAWLFRFRIWAIIPLLAFAAGRAGTGGRFPVIMALAALALLWLYEHRRRFPVPRMLLLVVVTAALFNLLGQDRGRSVRQLFGTDNTVERTVSGGDDRGKFLEGMDFANLEYFEYIVYVVPQRSHTYDYFLNNLQLFTEPVPRSLWPGKPAGPPITRF